MTQSVRKTGHTILWFKRDLRVADHRALALAPRTDPVLPLYVVEPELWRQPDMAARHWGFVAEALEELRADLAALGQPLIVRTGDVIEVLEKLKAEIGIKALWSHEETGNGWTFQRDLRVARWCRAAGVPWHEVRNHGVQRRIQSRDGWAKTWDRFMAEPLAKPPALSAISIEPGAIPSAADLGLAPDLCPARQRGGRRAGLERLTSFLETRGQTYRRAMSSPLNGAEACSRISPHLAWGTLSMREAAQASWARQADLKANPPKGVTAWRGSMTSFAGRLHWHCHFIQKLEDEPRIEFENFHRSYDGIRPSAPDQARLQAWAQGETGLPFVDACMRALRATGWLNFRMRAMVMAVASYHLWLHWREPGLELARLFTDYEPGIHWSQAQMQSGTTGINTVRIYNPVKQGHDQDPTGAFTRRWVPELAAIADAHLQEPWKAENASAVLGKAYPEPIVDHLAAAKSAREPIWAVRRGSQFRAEASAIQSKHGSRKSGIPNRGQRGRARPTGQLDLPLGE
ncbi:MAG: deoxyribodipyrimidine photo-lyase [Pseudomonadota bacterium]